VTAAIPHHTELERLLRGIDGRGYKAYKSLAPRYLFPSFVLRIDHVQGDPFADPTRVSVLVDPEVARLPADVVEPEGRRISVADRLNRDLAAELRCRSRRLGSGRSGEFSMLEPGQEVLRRTSATVRAGGGIEVRFRIGLPARGRTVLGTAAADLLCRELPAAVQTILPDGGRDDERLRRHVRVIDDTRALRQQLADRDLVAFVADGAILPRRSGVDDHPLPRDEAVPFQSPGSLRVMLETPHGGAVSGMGVPGGVTLFVGGGYHGKSTLLRAIERGIYDHVPGDGRERVVTRADAVKVRAEDGRSVNGTDIAGFIGRLPGGIDTRKFRTRNASGSTSQAAAIAEALELGSGCLLIDEDTSATNFLIRDARMQSLISDSDEPITPFLDRIAALRSRNVSVVLVVGGSGDYFDVADTVVAMREYRARDVTNQATAIAARLPAGRRESSESWSPPRPRAVEPEAIQTRRGHREVEVRAYSARRLVMGSQEVDLSGVEQLVEEAQTLAIGRALAWARGTCIDGRATIADAVACVVRAVERDGLDLIDPRLLGEYAEFRIFELAAVLNRLRSDA
jgi:predicted ABC-class ATPase